jgi:hypothetical protein
MDARRPDEYYGARVAPVAQLDRVLPSEGRGHGFESRQVHHHFFASLNAIRKPLQQKTRPMCGFFVVYFSSAVQDSRLSPYASNDLR